MGDRFRQQWEALGRSDPYWAVLSHPDKKGGRWDRDAFFATGEAEIAAIMARLESLDATPATGAALDFGCGVGRLCRALASRFDHVTGVDVSGSMLAEARAVNADLDNVAFVHNTAPTLAAVPDASVDLLYSALVLQHMPADAQRVFIADFRRVVRPGGAIVFQTPSRHDMATLKGWLHRMLGNRGVNLIRRLRHGPDGVMELHCLPRRKVMATLAAVGTDVLAVDGNTDAGQGFISYRYIATLT